MTNHNIDFNESQDNTLYIDVKGYTSIDHVSLKQKRAKRSLFELGIEEDNKLSMQLPPLRKKTKVGGVHGWDNQNLNKGRIDQKYKYNQDINSNNKINSARPFAQKETNIPYLKDLLVRLQTPNKKRGNTTNKKQFYYGSLQQSIRNCYKSARISDTIKLKQNWNSKQYDHHGSVFEPYTTSCRLFRSESRQNPPRANSQNSHKFFQKIKQSDLVKIILEKKKQTLVKKKKVLPAKILNFKAKTPRLKSKPKQKFHLFQLLN